VGGKRASAQAIIDVFPETVRRYFEPMLGGGAVFFALEATGRITEQAFLSDINHELILTFDVVQTQVEELIACLRSKFRYDKTEYDAWRALDPWLLDNDPEIAARMIYLNRTCFNGVYRVNRMGKFNVPFGRYTNPTICDADGLRAASRALAKATIRKLDCFNVLPVVGGRIVPEPEKGDAVYLDPPYVPLSDTANFTSYSAGGFTWNHQVRLYEGFEELASRGVAIATSNSSHPSIANLYSRYHIRPMQVRRSVNSRGSKRGPVTEVLITANCRGD
jgi:DNA adenine methylase